jgi:hypothetical protein
MASVLEAIVRLLTGFNNTRDTEIQQSTLNISPIGILCLSHTVPSPLPYRRAPSSVEKLVNKHINTIG